MMAWMHDHSRGVLYGDILLHGLAHSKTIIEADYLTNMLEERSEYDASIRLRLEIIDTLRGSRERDNFALAAALLKMTEVYIYEERSAEAEEKLVEAAHIVRTDLLMEPSVTQIIKIANIHATQSKIREASSMLEDCLQDLRASLAPWHPAIIRILGALSEAQRRQGSHGDLMRVHSELVNFGFKLVPATAT